MKKEDVKIGDIITIQYKVVILKEDEIIVELLEFPHTKKTFKPSNIRESWVNGNKTK